jgi:hypothetical protein
VFLRFVAYSTKHEERRPVFQAAPLRGGKKTTINAFPRYGGIRTRVTAGEGGNDDF